MSRIGVGTASGGGGAGGSVTQGTSPWVENITQVASTAIDTNGGVKSAGTIRVVLATDQPALTNKLLVTPDSVALPANQSVNISQINAVTPLMGAGNGGTGSLRVNIASDQVSIPVASTLSAETTKVIGTVNVAASQTIAVTNTGTFAAQATIADGASVTLGAKADAKSAATDTTAVSVMSVLKQISASVQAPPSQAVTNAGTFAVQATPVTQADTFMLGGVNIKEINAVTPLMGAGNGGTGSLRVNIASDQVSIPVAATLSAETTKVIGTVNPGNTANTTPWLTKPHDGTNPLFTAATALPNNHAVPTTTESGAILEAVNGIGNLDKIKTITSTFNTDSTGILASGMIAQLDDVSTQSITEDNFGVLRMSSRRALLIEGVASGTAVNVGQATGSNLHMVVDSGTVTTVSAVTAITNALPAGTNLMGKVGIDQTTPGTTNAVSIAQIGANTISSGVGTSGTGTFRTVIANDTGRTLLSKGGNAASSGNNTLVTAGTNRLKVYAFSLSTVSTTAVTCIFQSGAGGTELWRVTLQTPASVAGGANLVVQPPAWLFATASATLLNLNLSAAVSVDWAVSYFDES